MWKQSNYQKKSLINCERNGLILAYLPQVESSSPRGGTFNFRKYYTLMYASKSLQGWSQDFISEGGILGGRTRGRFGGGTSRKPENFRKFAKIFLRKVQKCIILSYSTQNFRKIFQQFNRFRLIWNCFTGSRSKFVLFDLFRQNIIEYLKIIWVKILWKIQRDEGILVRYETFYLEFCWKCILFCM